MRPEYVSVRIAVMDVGGAARLHPGRVADLVLVVAGEEPERRVPAAFDDGLAAVVDRHHALIAVAADLLGRVERVAVPVEERDEVGDGNAEFPEIGGITGVRGYRDHRLDAGGDLMAEVVRVEERRVRWFGDEGAEQAVLLSEVGEQVVVEEDRAELLVDVPAVDHL